MNKGIVSHSNNESFNSSTNSDMKVQNLPQIYEENAIHGMQSRIEYQDMQLDSGQNILHLPLNQEEYPSTNVEYNIDSEVMHKSMSNMQNHVNKTNHVNTNNVPTLSSSSSERNGREIPNSDLLKYSELSNDPGLSKNSDVEIAQNCPNTTNSAAMSKLSNASHAKDPSQISRDSNDVANLEMRDGISMWKSLWNISLSGNSPSGRWCHSCGKYKDNLIFLGGLTPNSVFADECYLYHIPTARWELKKIDTAGTKLDSISAHTLTIFEEYNEGILLGGSALALFDIFVLDLLEWKWIKKRATSLEKIEIEDDYVDNVYSREYNHDLEKTENVRIITKSVFPNPRSQHSAVQYKDEIIMFGGAGTNNDKFDDLWIFNRTKFEWQKPITSGRKPERRWGHDAARIGEYMYIFGGVVKSENSPIQHMSDELFSFHIKTRTWNIIEWDSGIPSPVPRAAHTLSAFEDKLIVLWGGDNNKYMKDLCVIDTTTFQVGRISFSSPIPRCSHTATVVDSFLYVLGGCDMESGHPRVYKDLYAVSLFAIIQRLKMNISQSHKPNLRILPNSNWFSHIRSEVLVDNDYSKNFDTNFHEQLQTKDVRRDHPHQSFSESQYYMNTQAKVITNWLVSLRLGKYAPNFVKEEIELEVLHTLTEEDLIKIGMDKMGPRKKILLAIQKFMHPAQESVVSRQQQSQFEMNQVILENMNINTSQLIHVASALNRSVDALNALCSRILLSPPSPNNSSNNSTNPINPINPINSNTINHINNINSVNSINGTQGKYVHRRRRSLKFSRENPLSVTNQKDFKHGSHSNTNSNSSTGTLIETNPNTSQNNSATISSITSPSTVNEANSPGDSPLSATSNIQNEDKPSHSSNNKKKSNENSCKSQESRLSENDELLDVISGDPNLKGLSWFEICEQDEELQHAND